MLEFVKNLQKIHWEILKLNRADDHDGFVHILGPNETLWCPTQHQLPATWGEML